MVSAVEAIELAQYLGDSRTPGCGFITGETDLDAGPEDVGFLT